MLLEATGGLSLSQVCAVTGLEGSTIQNWVKRGWVAHPNGKKYEEVHIARILIINALKECIKLEHIALLMKYVNGADQAQSGDIIRESELFNFLCEALGNMGQARDNSRGGVETVVDSVIAGYVGPKPDSRNRIRKALTLMIYACVCTDVKRRTESMMRQILHDLEHPEEAEAEVIEEAEAANEAANEAVAEAVTEAEEEQTEQAESSETRKTVSQALREWDISSVERIIIDHSGEDSGSPRREEKEKPVNRPWFSRKSSKH
jgi:DNA-binding transcriptional MerR regulator